jgi:hypothetical protein
MTSMTSFLEVDAADERHLRLASRKAVVVASQRVDEQYGEWLRQAATREDLDQRIAYAHSEIGALVAMAADEHGMADGYQQYFQTILDGYTARFDDEHKTAAVHESRKPKMCPFHKDVVDISLAAADARAGFDSMAQHWGGPRHCEGEGYEGSKCNFKAPMVTQAYWDEKAEKAEERKQQRAEQAELDTQQGDEIIDEPVAEGDEITEPIAEGDHVGPAPVAEDNVIDVDFGGGSTNGEEPTAEVPMSMAASMTKEAPGNQHVPGASPKRNRQYEHIKQQYIEDGLSEEEAAERAARTVNKQRAEHGETKGSSKTADDGNGGFGGPEPTIDKRKWTPQTVPFLDVDEDDGPNPTKRKDIVEPIKPQNGPRFSPTKLDEIGEQQTEHQDVTKGVDYIKTDQQGGVWSEGPATAISSTLPNDVNENPITALVKGDYDGFLPASTVQQAIAAHRK